MVSRVICLSLLVHVTEPEQTNLVRELAMAHRFWKERGFVTDLVIVNDYPGSYYDALQDQIISMLRDVFHSPDHPGVFTCCEVHSWAMKR